MNPPTTRGAIAAATFAVLGALLAGCEPVAAATATAHGATPTTTAAAPSTGDATATATAAITTTTASAAPATGTAGATALPTVQSDMKRGTSFPYKRLNELLAKLRTEGEGLFVSRFVLTDAKDSAKPPPAGTKLALMSDEEYIPIPIDEKGGFDLPTFPANRAKDMDFGTNAAKGDLGVRLSIDLSTPPEMLDMATVRRVVAVGQRLRTELLPWYVRWMFPQIDGVIACSDQPQWNLDWAEGGQRWRLPLPAEAQQREPETPKGKPSRACTVLTGQEQWPDAALFLPPPGANTKLYVKLRNTRAN
ncbi:hypothetical protein [Mitsuaria sp. GD03876]|uniref:hypothetical protein n=1 Tax=Mitsuaria sp. GD03876 TaxID=2975399 RepID=UPI0024486A9B|nr:hypothetical protein [Mitsuaria sp. GD03876]MDH0865304.1 hypothetical protein [Mitsuaria sp. GD03876]